MRDLDAANEDEPRLLLFDFLVAELRLRLLFLRIFFDPFRDLADDFLDFFAELRVLRFLVEVFALLRDLLRFDLAPDVFPRERDVDRRTVRPLRLLETERDFFFPLEAEAFTLLRRRDLFRLELRCLPVFLALL